MFLEIYARLLCENKASKKIHLHSFLLIPSLARGPLAESIVGIQGKMEDNSKGKRYNV